MNDHSPWRSIREPTVLERMERSDAAAEVRSIRVARPDGAVIAAKYAPA
ncbi:hypothetical protein J7E25_09175 [Agromyces sp. ISL-38]|nr:hypothetical protein [Agromyces sp. ISL-38]MBT2499268.1 hypothetical protein [Agromyces sp. ISL-38]MBT2518195.1 hypothetical protein [Streptomyces sp. ISL-90]